jgi:hypothetical protein
MLSGNELTSARQDDGMEGEAGVMRRCRRNASERALLIRRDSGGLYQLALPEGAVIFREMTLQGLDGLLSGRAGAVAQKQLDARAGIPHRAAPRIGEAACLAGPSAFQGMPR